MLLAMNENSSKPLYEQVGDLIRRRLVENVYRPGTALPSEIQLAGELGVSQGTVRKAINDLVAEHILFRRQGLGTFVSEHTEHRLLFVYFNVARDDGARMLPKSKILAFRKHTANREEREKLELAVGAKVFRLERLRFFEDDPMMVEYLSVACDLFVDLGGKEPIPDHLYRYYQSAYGITVAKAREELKAVGASETEAKLLGIGTGAPLLLIDRVAMTLEMQPVEWRRTICNTQSYHVICERG